MSPNQKTWIGGAGLDHPHWHHKTCECLALCYPSMYTCKLEGPCQMNREKEEDWICYGRLYHNKPHKMQLLSPTEWTSLYLTARNGTGTVWKQDQYIKYMSALSND